MPARKALPWLIRDTHQALVDIANRSGGGAVRVGLGVSSAYLVTNPDDIQRVLEQADVYPRPGDTALWRSVRKLVGDGILAEGDTWTASRRTLAPLFRATRVDALVGTMAEAIEGSAGRLDEAAATGTPIDIGAELSRMVAAAIMRVFFADRVSVDSALRIMAAQEVIVTSMAPRLLAPFVPWWIRLPGDRQFHAAVQAIDDILLPVLREALQRPGDGDDVLSTLARARTADGHALSEKQMRDDLVSMVAVTTETTYVVLTWLWPVLANHPHIAARLYDEIDEVVGRNPVRADHLPNLAYTKMVLQELLRLYPAGWIVPRRAAAADVLGRVRIEQGSTIVLSPYATHRMSSLWGPNAEVFDPERFAPGREGAEERHRYAYYPFGGGKHRCLGEHLFNLEAILIVATLLSRFRFTLTDPALPGTRVAASLRPARRVKMILTPLERTAAR
ncbi:cytochrome P450 [Micromonospora thermarum]|uniref:Cytochrome P450 n=1 Tax=Micromonospora thermarum TaxID=2720024 RepID=A0ABX0Z8N7_9ACTN|nr:cytochrome P450 [Micromonospora thermarum]NJP32466.1 cytochrome P450 [Micromonospora thermarum]